MPQLSTFPHDELGQLLVDMANTQRNSEPGEAIPTNPIVVVQDIGQLSRDFLREVGSRFWIIAHTFEETIDRLRHGRVPFVRRVSFATPSARVWTRCLWLDSFHFSSA